MLSAKFLKKVERETPKDKSLHLIADNYAPHKHPVVKEWLSKHPRITMHFTPTSASWLNMVERFFRDITTEQLRRGVFTSVPELIATIDAYIAHHNKNPKPFIWTKSARDPAKGHSCQQALKFQTECNTTLVGTLSRASYEEAKKTLESLGANVVDSMSEDTDYVIAGDDAAASDREKAKVLGIRVLSDAAYIIHTQNPWLTIF